MNRKWLVLGATLLLIFILCGSVWAGDAGHAIMRPDHDTLRRWIADYEKAPKAPMNEAIKSKLTAMKAVGATSSMSLLSRVPYLGSQRNQGSCGNCWVWAGTGLMEIAHNVQNSVSDRLSIQYLNSCKTDDFACNGGNLVDLTDWYQGQARAIPWSNTNASYADGSGPPSPSMACGNIGTSPNYPLTDFTPQTIATTESTTQDQAIANIKNVLNQNKGVWFAFWLANDTDWTAFYTFWDNPVETAVWNPDPYCGHTWDDNSGGGHAVIIVGYNDDDANPENHYWTVLNSWSTPTGKPQGTFRMKMNLDFNCKLLWSSGSDFTNNQFQTIGIDYVDPCNPPTSISVPASSTGSFTVSWGASTTPGASYVLEESTTSGFSSTTVVYSGTALSTVITKSSNGAFYYRVRATADGYAPSSYRSSATGCVVDIPGIVSYNSSDVPKAIPDIGLATSTITVPATSCSVINDINVNLNITHTFDSDLAVSITHNGSGRTVQLFNRSCSSDSDLIAPFDDEAPAAVQCPPNGTYQPASPLSYLDGLDPAGTWALTVSDNEALDTGTLNSWGFSITCPPISRQLNVAISGNGSVNSTPNGIACGTGNTGYCSAQFDDGTPVTLTASGVVNPAYLSQFGSWTGSYNSANGASCQVVMGGSRSVTASFITNQPVYIPGGNHYPSLQAAYDAGAGACTINAQAVELPALDFTLDKGKSVILEGGYNSDYYSSTGNTTMKGVLTLGTGSLNVDRLTIK